MYTDDVFAALRGSRREHPVGISDVLMAVDARQRVMLTLDELNAALASLIGEGRAQEVEPGCYAAGAGSRPFTAIAPAAFDAAVEEYRRRFDAVASAEPDDSGTLVKLRFDTSERKPSDAELDDFTDALEDEIGSVADVLGFEIGGDVVELHILVDEGESAESVASACALAARAWDAADGHHVVIVEADGTERRFP